MTDSVHIVAYDRQQLLKPIFEQFHEIFNFSYSFENDWTSAKALFLVEEENQTLDFVKRFTGKGVKIIYFEEATKKQSRFRQLKCNYGVDYVLELPIIEDEVAALLRTILREMPRIEVSEFIPHQLIKKYDEAIFDKLERIESLMHQTQKAETLNANLLEIRNEIHKITGTAATYGYPEAGKLCAAHEMYLYNIYSGKSYQALENIVRENRSFFRKLKLLFQHILLRIRSIPQEIIPSIERSDRIKEGSVNAKTLIRAVTSDFNLAFFLQSLAAKRSVTIRIDDNPQVLFESDALNEADLKLVISDEYFPYTKLTGIDLIKKMKDIIKESPPLFCIISDKEDLAKRIELMESGVDFIIVKPVTNRDVEEMINHSLQNRISFPAKILVVDDDPDFGSLVSEVLRSANFNPLYISDERELLRALDEFNPDMLILDIMLKSFNGKILLRALRKDSRYRDLLIVICTALPIEEADESAYTEGCDAVVHKPLIPHIFLSRLLNLFERKRSSIPKSEIDPVTGLMTKKLLFDQIETYVAYSSNDLRWSLIYLKISIWEELEKVLTPLEAKQVQILFSENMKTHFSTSVCMGTLSPGYFCLLFKRLSGSEIEFLLSSFFEKIQSKMMLPSRTDLQLSAVASAVLFSAKDAKLEEIAKVCGKGLLEAIRQGINTCKISRFGEFSTKPDYGKQIILVDDDLDLCEILEFAFEKYGYHVTKFHNLRDSLLFFAGLPQVEKDTLVILDRRLPDGDGLDLLRKIYDKFPRLKAIFLSSVSNEQEILDALRAGALDYLVKPFSIEVLLEKVSIFLNR
ncbi:MAG: response regulator [Chlamydiales bacterium]|nr:response regulator [Chlamydiales bacterium]